MQHAIKIIFIFVTLTQLVACGSLKTRQQLRGQGQKSEAHSNKKSDQFQGAQDSTFDAESPVVETTEIETPSAPISAGLPKVALILGPGGVKAFAHTGVIKELIRQHVPIDAVVGMEWGALVAGLYAQAGQVHEAEWKLYKLKEKDMPGKSLFSSKYKAASIKSLEGFFKENFQAIKTNQTKVNFACPSLSLWSGTIVWQDRGDLASSVERCTPYPPLFKPQSPWMAAAFSLNDAVAYLKNKGYGLIIFVNVLGGGDIIAKEDVMEEYKSAILWEEMRRYYEAHIPKDIEVINVETRKFKLFDFNNRNVLVKAGEEAGKKAADRLGEKYGF